MSIIILLFIYSFSTEIIIKNGVYKIYYNNLYFNYEDNIIKISKLLKNPINSDFRIKSISKDFNNSFYYIEHINTNLQLISSQNNQLKFALNLVDSENEFSSWTFIQTENNKYKIRNKNKCFINVKELFVSCENINFENASQFYIIKIYEEASYNKFTFY